uniref:Uncharacterized protein n=1 Tax=Romanomermis culicivorax TaxID=13658 RepID=A0A915JTB8_ROMCU
NEEKELKKKAAHGHIYDFGDQGLSAEQYAKQKEVQNFMLEQEINDMKRLCKLKMEKRLIEEAKAED